MARRVPTQAHLGSPLRMLGWRNRILHVRFLAQTPFLGGALVLMVAAVLMTAFAFPSPAVAEEDVSLVSNTGQGTASDTNSFSLIRDYRQSFTTGGSSDGYTLTGVDLALGEVNPNETFPTYSLQIVDASGASLGTLGNPDSFAAGLNRHTASGDGIDLSPNTTYRILLDVTAGATAEHWLAVTASDAEDAEGLTGWSIGDEMQSRTQSGNWSDHSNAMKVAILGSANDTTPPTLVGGTVERDSYLGLKGRVKLYFSEELDPALTPLKSDFSMLKGDLVEEGHSGSWWWYEFVRVNGNTLELDITGLGIAANQALWVQIEDPSRIRDLAGNQTEAPDEPVEIVNLYAVPYFLLPPGAPRLGATDPLVVDGSTLTVKFDQTLVPFTTLTGTGGFSVSGAAEATAVTHVDTALTTVVLTLDREVGESETGIELSYEAGTAPIRNFFGERAAGFESRAVVNAAAEDLGDTVPPSLVAGAIEGTAAGTDVRLWFSEEMFSGIPKPAGSQFVLSAGSDGTDLGAVTLASISGSVVRLRTANAALATDTVTLTITDTSNISDAFGNEMAAVNGFSLANLGATGPGSPELASADPAVLEGNVLTLAFDQTLDPENVPPSSAFTVSGVTPPAIVDAVAVEGARVLLTLRQEVPGGSKGLAVSYDDNAGKQLRNLWRETAEGFQGQPVRVGGTDVVAPAVVRAEVRGDELKLYFDEPLDGNHAPAGVAFRVVAETSDFTDRLLPGKGTATIADNVATVMLAGAVKEDELLEARYYPDRALENPLQDEAGNRVGTACHAAWVWCGNTWEAANIDAYPPSLISGTVSGTSVTLHFSEPLDGSVTPAASQFTFSGASVGAVTDVTVDGIKITMTTENTVAAGTTLTLTIDNTANIRDRGGNQAEAVANGFALINLLDADTGAPALVAKDEEADPPVYPVVVDGAYLTLTYDRTLDPLSVPIFRAFDDDGFRGPFQFVTSLSVRGLGSGSYVVVHGTRVILSLLGPVSPCRQAVLPTPEGNPNENPSGVWKDMVLTYDPSRAGTAPHGPLQNLWGTDAAGFTDVEVVNARAHRCVWRAVHGSSAQGKSLTVRFDRTLVTSDAPDPAAFSVERATTEEAAATGAEADDAEAPAVESAAFAAEGKAVVLGLSRAVAHGESLTVRYTRPEAGDGLWDTEGNELASFSGVPVEDGSADTSGPALSVGDARAKEGATLAFVVRLDAPSEREVTVAYETVDGTAVAGADYRAASGTLTFAPGEREQTVPVATFADERSEGEEALMLSLSNAAGATIADAHGLGLVTNVAPEQPLTASFEGVPAEHDEEGAFSFGLTFSEEVKLSFRTLKESALVVQNGRVTQAQRVVKGENRRWTVTVRPASLEDVAVALLSPSPNCRATGAICTPGGKPLSNAPETRVPGPALLSVADAEGDEGGDPALAFEVRLSRAALGVVTVDYATADGTATAGDDYTAASGTLTFAAGQTEQTIEVAALADRTAEHAETFIFTLSNPSGAAIADGQATGTVVDLPPPAATGVAVVSDPGDDDTYGLDDVIRIRLVFSEAVDVTGSPRLKIDMDPAHWGQKWAVYESGSGTTELTFAHTVVEPNTSTQGIAVLADTLELNGGTIRSASSRTDADLAHEGLAHDPNHKVDWR